MKRFLFYMKLSFYFRMFFFFCIFWYTYFKVKSRENMAFLTVWTAISFKLIKLHQGFWKQMELFESEIGGQPTNYWLFLGNKTWPAQCVFVWYVVCDILKNGRANVIINWQSNIRRIKITSKNPNWRPSFEVRISLQDWLFNYNYNR